MSTQTKLLIFHPTIAPYRIDFFNDLSKSFQTRICLRYWNLRDQTFDYQKIYTRFQFRPFYLKELFRFLGRSFSWGYWKQLNDYAPDLVLTEEFGLGTLRVLLHRYLKRKRYKVVTLCDDSYDMIVNRNDFSWWHRMARRYLAPRLDDIIVVSPQVRDWYQEHLGKGYFVPILQEEEYARTRYRKVLERVHVLRQRYSMKHKKVFLFVGRLVAPKNVKVILRAFARLDQKRNLLVIVGDGPEFPHLILLAKQLNLQVRFTGRLEGDALYAWYNAADVFVLASRQEPFGAVTNEALLAGCYVLVSQKAGSSCLVVEGENGYTFEPDDIDALVEKMEQVSQWPIVREPDGLKKCQTKISYRESMQHLVTHLKFLVHG